MQKDELLATLRAQKPLLHEKYGVSELGIFGSRVRGDATPTSDLDVLVEFDRAIGLIEFSQLKRSLEDKFDIPIDLVRRKVIKPALREQILNEVEYV